MSREIIRDIIGSVEMFRELNEAEQEQLASIMRISTMPAGSLLFDKAE